MKGAERLDSRTIFRGRVVDLWVDRVRLPNDRVAELELIHHRGAAAVVPLLPDDRVILLRQFRYATGGWLLEVPAGKLDGTEEPAACARRELTEETGYRLAEGKGELTPLGWIWTSPGFTDEKIWLYLATGLERVGGTTLEDDEILHPEILDLHGAVDQAVQGQIHDAKTVCALLRAARHLGR